MGIFDKVGQDDFDKYKNIVHIEFEKLLTEFEQHKNLSQSQFMK